MNEEETKVADLTVDDANPEGVEGTPIPPTPAEEEAPVDDTRVLNA